MALYKCDHCRNTFTLDECSVYTQCVGEAWGVPQYEDWCACPFCFSTDISETEEEEEE